jgi:hypothetical protein
MPELNELRRLVGAVEALSLEAQSLLTHHQYAEICELQSRENVIVARVSELISMPSVRTRMDEALWARLRSILLSYSSKSAALDEAMADARVALAEIDQASRRAQKIRPAYAAMSRSPFGVFAGEG